MFNVLLVDDEYMIISGLKYLIPWEEKGLNLVGTAFNGEEALEVLKREKIDIVISDVTMPIMSGIDFLREARKQEYQFQTIFLSGYQEFEYAKEGMALGAINYLLKPVDKRELFESLDKAIQKIKEKNDIKKIIQFKEKNKVKQWLEKGLESESNKESEILKATYYNVFVGSFMDDSFLDDLDKDPNVFYYVEENRLSGIIINQSKEELKDYYITLAQKYAKDVFLFSGPVVTESEKLYESHKVALSLEDSYYFYNLVQDGCIWIELNNHLEEIYYSNSDELPLLSQFSKQNSVEEGINNIITFFNKTPIPPNHVRYFTLLLLSDARTYYDLKYSKSYQEEVDEIRGLKNITEVEAVFKDLEQEIKLLLNERSYSELTNRVIEVIHQDFGQDIRLKEVADDLFVNAMYLGQIFKRDTNQTFSQFLNTYRMKKSEELLIKTMKNVNEIALEVGYSSSGYFYKNFKDAYGTTPRDFREQYLSM